MTPLRVAVGRLLPTGIGLTAADVPEHLMVGLEANLQSEFAQPLRHWAHLEAAPWVCAARAWSANGRGVPAVAWLSVGVRLWGEGMREPLLKLRRLWQPDDDSARFISSWLFGPALAGLSAVPEASTPNAEAVITALLKLWRAHPDPLLADLIEAIDQRFLPDMALDVAVRRLATGKTDDIPFRVWDKLRSGGALLERGDVLQRLTKLPPDPRWARSFAGLPVERLEVGIALRALIQRDLGQAPRVDRSHPVLGPEDRARVTQQLADLGVFAPVPRVEHALLGAVYAAPDDDGPRAVLADYWTERGDPRGPFIAAQLQSGEVVNGEVAPRLSTGPWLPIAATPGRVWLHRGFPFKARVHPSPALHWEAGWSTLRTLVAADDGAPNVAALPNVVAVEGSRAFAAALAFGRPLETVRSSRPEALTLPASRVGPCPPETWNTRGVRHRIVESFEHIQSSGKHSYVQAFDVELLAPDSTGWVLKLSRNSEGVLDQLVVVWHGPPRNDRSVLGQLAHLNGVTVLVQIPEAHPTAPALTAAMQRFAGRMEARVRGPAR